MSPTSAEAISLLDTSAAVPMIVAGHEHHESTFAALQTLSLGLAGHAAFETFSVLTRIPPPARLAPAAVDRLLRSNFPHSRFLSTSGTAELFGSLAEHGIAGGSVYDALVGAAALEHGLTLVTRDRRALVTYRELGVTVEMLL